MKARGRAPLHRRFETWLWTGPVGHLLGGTLDVAQALIVYVRKRKKAGSSPSSR
jgi:uncharacterized membrane-anchored protein